MSAALADYWGQRSFLQPNLISDWCKRPETDFKLTRGPKESKGSIPTPIPTKARRVCGIVISEALNHVADAVEKSEYILHLPDNWDDEGSPPYERETWERAAKFALRVSAALWRKEQVLTDPPAIHNGPKASIDIHWKNPKAELLINVPAAFDRPATYYGLNKETGFDIKGNLDTSASNEWLLMWIAAK
jgi:hypothetical protein